MAAPAPLGTVKALPLGDIRPAADNPRRIPKSAVDIVAKSIAEFGWQQPIVVDTDNVIIAGHTRHLAAKQLKLDAAPVVVADHLTPEQVRAYRIADNRSGDFTSWDFTALTAQLDELAADFSDVLALADWQAIVTEFETLTPTAQPFPGHVPAGAVSEPDDEDEDPDEDEDAAPPPTASGTRADPIANYLSGEFALTVVCDCEGSARAIAAKLIDMEGVVDVRDKR